MIQRCEACELVAAHAFEPTYEAENPYRVCAACHHRLLARSLRPLEWYNLTKRHGWQQFLLHDDFYNDDGTAWQPTEAVEQPESLPAPTLERVAKDPQLLFDYSITRWHLRDDVVSVWRQHPPSNVLFVLMERYATVGHATSRIFEIVGTVLGPIAADFVRRAWDDYPVSVRLFMLAQATASTLPPDEAFDRVTGALAKLEERERRDQIRALAFLHSDRALDWIEENIFEPITGTWGSLAAESKLDWHRIERWLDAGRPLSFVAIDALVTMLPLRPLPAHKIRPRLKDPPDLQRLQEALSAYSLKDSVPRVRNSVRAIINNASALLTAE